MMILEEISINGFSKKPPFCIGKNYGEMVRFAKTNGIPLAGGGLYTSSKALAHMTRKAKIMNGIRIPNEYIANFSLSRKRLDLFYDWTAKLFIYVDAAHRHKYVINPNYEVKIRGKKMLRVMFITASAIKSTENFYNDRRRYAQIKKSSGD